MSALIDGLVVRCAMNGTVREIVGDSFGVCGALKAAAPEVSFVELVDEGSRPKAEAFLRQLRAQRAVFGWEMNVRCGDVIFPAHFAGAIDEAIAVGDETIFIIVGARSRGEISRFYAELTRNRDAPSDAQRATQMDWARLVREQSERDRFYFDELSRLNNELAAAQRELARKNAELARLNEQKNLFLGIASHDLRNPLNVIQTYSDFLLEEATPLNAEQLEFVRKIRAASDFMLKLVNDFLDYAKIEAGRFDLDARQTNLAPVVHRVVAEQQIAAARKQVEIQLDAPEKLPAVFADASKIEQVLRNLIENALKFSPVRETIKVAVETTETQIIFSVADAGAGIAAEDAERLFQPFVRGKDQARRGEKSAGLGLAIVKKIVESHRGKVWFESIPAKGTKFFFALPRDQS